MHRFPLPLLPSLSSLSLLPIPPSLSEVIHPAQVPAVREAFSPSEERVQWASRLISAFNHHQHSGHVSLLHYMQVSWVWLICCFSLVFSFHTSLMIHLYCCLRDLAVPSLDPGSLPSLPQPRTHTRPSFATNRRDEEVKLPTSDGITLPMSD